LDTFYNKKADCIKKNIESQKEIYHKRTDKLQNSFYQGFFEQCIESTVMDAYEIFLEDNTEHNYFKKHRKELDEECGQRFFKLMAIHHSIKMVRKKRKKLKWSEMCEAMCTVFQLTKTEVKLADILYGHACIHDGVFSFLFARVAAGYLFFTPQLNPFSVAFIENFCYNSYNNFMASFTKYLSVNLRLRKAAR